MVVEQLSETAMQKSLSNESLINENRIVAFPFIVEASVNLKSVEGEAEIKLKTSP